MFPGASLCLVLSAAPAGFPAPNTALELLQRMDTLRPATTKVDAPELSALFGDASDGEAVAPGLGLVPKPLKKPLPALTPTRARVTSDGPNLMNVTFYDPKLDQRLVFTLGRRMAEASSKERDVLVLIDTPAVEHGPGKENSEFVAVFELKGTAWTEAKKPEAPFSVCERVLRRAASDLGTALLLQSVETNGYSSDVASLHVEVTRGVSAKVVPSKDKKHFTADVLYRGAVARFTDETDQPKLITPCAPGR